jgi:hypothetical protein
MNGKPKKAYSKAKASWSRPSEKDGPHLLRLEAETTDPETIALFSEGATRRRLASRFWAWALMDIDAPCEDERRQAARWDCRSETEKGQWLMELIRSKHRLEDRRMILEGDCSRYRMRIARLEALAIALGAEDHEIESCEHDEARDGQ